MARNTTLAMSAAGVVTALVLVFALSSASNLVPSQVSSQNVSQTELSRSTSSPSSAFTPVNSNSSSTGPSATFVIASSQEFKKFASFEEMQAYIVQSVSDSQRAAATGAGAPFQTILPLGGAGGLADRNFPSYGGMAAPTAPSVGPQAAPAMGQAQSAKSSAVPLSGAQQHSTTNAQVTNVDEPDFLKNDAKYAFILTGDKLTIVNAYPAENASVTVKVGLDIPQGRTLQNMFLNGNRLAIFYQDYSQDYVIPQYGYQPEPVTTPRTHIVILDITDRESPKLLHDYKVSGNYNDARMIGDYVYIITTSSIDDYYHPIVPRIMEASKVVATPDIYYFDNPEQSFGFTTVTSVNIQATAGNSALVSKTYLMDPASTVYASENNLYIAYQKYMPYYYYESNSKDRFFKAVVPLLPSRVQGAIMSVDQDKGLSMEEKWDKISAILQDYYNTLSESDKAQLYDSVQRSLANYDAQLQKDLKRTVIHKIALGQNGALEYVARGEVPGRLLNQFSMDENGTIFRVATTSEYYSQYRAYQYNNVYVLGDKLNIIGRLEQIAENESIYSARFIGDRLYLVTFRQVDPLFVIDLSSPTQPKVLGTLKLAAGYSNYLHPFDSTHLIGIGRDTQDNTFGGVEPLGVKLALFDVSDVSNPVTVGTYQIGGMGTDSEALYEHKAFFFDRQTDTLSIPVSISQNGTPVPLESQWAPVPENGSTGSGSVGTGVVSPGMPIRPPGNFWRGFYVFGVDTQHGFTLKAKIEHYSSENDSGPYNPYPYYGLQGSRTFCIGNVLYTVSISNIMKMNSLVDPSHEINELDLGNTGSLVKYVQPQSDLGAAPAPSNATTVGNSSGAG